MRSQPNNQLRSYLPVLLPILGVGIPFFVLFGLLIRPHRPQPPKPTPQFSPQIAVVITPSPTPEAATSPSLVEPAVSYHLPEQQPIPILMYHYIRDYTDPKDKIGVNLSVSPTTFAQQLAALKGAGYTTVTFNDLDQPLPAKPIILTFDDGYDDAYTAALPALKQQGMRAVFYLVTQFLNTPHYLTTDQAKALDAEKMEIASHTVDHHELAKQSETQQQIELSQSKTTLETLIGKPIDHFCYPSGKYNAVTLGLDKTVGYRTATTTKPGIATGHSFNTTPYELPRVRVTNQTDLLKELGDRR